MTKHRIQNPRRETQSFSKNSSKGSATAPQTKPQPLPSSTPAFKSAAAKDVEKLNGSTASDDKVLFMGRAQSKAERKSELEAKIEQKKIRRYEKLQGSNLYLKNLDDNINDDKLKELFSEFESVTSCKVKVDSNGQSKGYGYVQIDNEESAQNAMKHLNGMLINEKKVYVELFVPRHERTRANRFPKFTNVYVNNLLETTTDDDLKKLFGAYGTITSAVVMTDANGKSRCSGFVHYQSTDEAAAAVEKLNGTTVSDDKVLFVGRAQSKAEREAELKAKIEQKKIRRYEKLQGSNFILTNLDDNINDDKLKELFSEFGSVTSCKVEVDSNGQSKGFEYVRFDNEESAQNAMKRLNDMLINDKKFYVELFGACGTINIENLSGTTAIDHKDLFVGSAQSKAEREQHKLEASFPRGATSCKVMLDPQGHNEGSGSVSFSTLLREICTKLEKLNKLRSEFKISVHSTISFMRKQEI